MDNNAYAQSCCCIKIPYVINVKKFQTALLCLPKQGSVAYLKPSTKSKPLHTFSAPETITDRYPITQLVFCDYDYWVKIPELVDFKAGYVKCSDAGINYEKYVVPKAQTPNPQIGTNTDAIFNMWYFPNSTYKGVNYATPLYYQYYGDNKNTYKCTLLSSISGLYRKKGIYNNPMEYLYEMTKRYWTSDGVSDWLATMNVIAIQNNNNEIMKKAQDEIRKKAKENLDNQKPMLVGASDGDTPHMVLVVGYQNSGYDLNDYIVLDSSKTEFSDLQAFFDQFHYASIKWEYLNGGYVYGEY
ncbi:MAG: hypothetical protein HDT44_11025 [Ruminococcaceae bacterium]|nr:hypothetical protein [Oscillospiraceae bacterium]